MHGASEHLTQGTHPVNLAYVRTLLHTVGDQHLQDCAKYLRTCLFFPLYTKAAMMRMILRSLVEHIGPTGIYVETSCVGRILYLPLQKDSISWRMEDRSISRCNQPDLHHGGNISINHGPDQ